jgi:formylglycine-generating enzyme required for sulfatase activity
MDRIAAHVGDPAWREVALLTVGYLGIRQQLPRVAGDVVEALADEQPGAPGEAVVLAGEAVLDAWPGGVLPGSKARVIEALVPAMQAAAVPAPLRRRAGLLLGRLGWLPADLDEFVVVPAGEFLYGDDKQKRRIPHHYWIGKYPVTNAQYARFIADKGYERQELWSADGWRWRIGSYDTTATESWEKDSLERRPPELRRQPFWWDDLERANPIFLWNSPTPSSQWSASRGLRRKPMPTGSTRGRASSS